ncbi:MAG: sulfatase-like hydrolase/transferase [Candidatus Solibacter usitatus]|nr:sulfatase-like hydrolase/transferase [Candidatus Solibacter usitatus]
MTRRTFFASITASAASPRRPNVILLLADDLGSGDLSSFGAKDIRTPHIDSIGARGVRFTQCYSNGPECSPTRTALMTGRYQQRVGGLECAIGVGNVGRYDEAIWLQKKGELGLPASETTMPRLFRQHGYDTACFGKWHLGYLAKHQPRRHGFDEYFGILGGNADYFTHREDNGALVLYRNEKPLEAKGYLTDLIAGEAVAWLKRRKDKPFFLYVPFNAPHTPIQDPDGFDATTGSAKVQQGVRGVYAKMVERVDARVGAILDQLRAMGQEENTIVVFLSDNGGDPNGNNGSLRGRKGSTWEGGIRVPGMMQWPGHIKPAVSPQVVLSMDLMPTLLAGAGIRAARRLDGVDLMPVLTGAQEPFARTVFWRYKREKNRRKAVRDGDWKLVVDNGVEELHNLAADGGEKVNLLSREPERAAELRKKLAAWEHDVEASRLRGFRP